MNKHQKELLQQVRRERDEGSLNKQEDVDREAVAKEAPCYGTEIAEGKHEFSGNACMLCGRDRGGLEKAEKILSPLFPDE